MIVNLRRVSIGNIAITEASSDRYHVDATGNAYVLTLSRTDLVSLRQAIEELL